MSLVAWYEKGGWNEYYQMFSLFDGEDIVANVSVSTLTLLLEGQRAREIQFSAVGTLPAYRRQGLARQWMAHVLEHYAASTDLFFLFANASVTEEWRVVTSLWVHYKEGFEVEFGMTTPMWAELPVDPGTQHVVSHGMRILCDREGMLGRLRAAVAAS